MTKSKKPEPPIQNLDALDVIAKRKDGGLDLFIVVSSRLLDTEEHRSLLYNKLNTYLSTIELEEFQAEFARPKAIRILVSPSVAPDAGVASWITSVLAPEVRKLGYELVLEPPKTPSV